MSRDEVVVARQASSGNLLRTNSVVTRFPVKSRPCAATITAPAAAAKRRRISDSSDHVAAAKVLRRSRIHISTKRCADHRPSNGRDNDADSSGHTRCKVVLVLSGVVDGVADRPGDAVTVVVQPALGALELKFAPRRDGKPLEEDVGLFDAVIQPPTVATRP